MAYSLPSSSSRIGQLYQERTQPLRLSSTALRRGSAARRIHTTLQSASGTVGSEGAGSGKALPTFPKPARPSVLPQDMHKHASRQSEQYFHRQMNSQVCSQVILMRCLSVSSKHDLLFQLATSIADQHITINGHGEFEGSIAVMS